MIGVVLAKTGNMLSCTVLEGEMIRNSWELELETRIKKRLM